MRGGSGFPSSTSSVCFKKSYMETPETNPEGYARACALNYVNDYPSDFKNDPAMLRLTHGTGDDNVHYQNTLLLIDALQKAGKHFELMLYPPNEKPSTPMCAASIYGREANQSAHSQKSLTGQLVTSL